MCTSRALKTGSRVTCGSRDDIARNWEAESEQAPDPAPLSFRPPSRNPVFSLNPSASGSGIPGEARSGSLGWLTGGSPTPRTPNPAPLSFPPPSGNPVFSHDPSFPASGVLAQSLAIGWGKLTGNPVFSPGSPILSSIAVCASRVLKTGSWVVCGSRDDTARGWEADAPFTPDPNRMSFPAFGVPCEAQSGSLG